MNEPISIKSTIFRFATVRAADLIAPTDKTTKFIPHDEFEGSEFSKILETKEPDQITEHIRKIDRAKTRHAVRDLHPEIYDWFSSNLAGEYGHDGKRPEDGRDGRIEPLSCKDRDAVWSQLYANLFDPISPSVTKALAHLIRADHAASRLIKSQEKIEEFDWDNIGWSFILIPTDLVMGMEFLNSIPCSGNMHGVKNLGILEYRRIEQTVCCYVPGEVSHIENVLAREYKERHTRNFVSTEVTQEEKTAREIENMTDTATTDRNEISSEVSRVLAEERSRDFGGSVSVSGKYYGVEIGVDTNLGFSSTNSSTQSNTDAQNFAKEIVARAVEKIVTKVEQKRTARILKEFEENNRHGFDNREGDHHVTGVYRWVDKIYENEMVNYGRQLVLEFNVPQPAKFFNQIQEQVRRAKAEEAAQGLEKPKTLEDFDITSPETITENSLKLAQEYFDVSIPARPDPQKVIVKSYTPQPPLEHNRGTASQAQPSVVIPDGYMLINVSGSYSYQYRANSWTNGEVAFCDLSIGGVVTPSGGDYSADKENKTVSVSESFSPGLEGTVPVVFTYAGTFTFSGSITYKCAVKPAVEAEWRSQTYAALQDAEQAQLAAYEAERNEIIRAQEAAEAEVGKTLHPHQKRLIEQRELKRLCIEMLMRPYCHALGKDFYAQRDKCEDPIPEVVQSPALDSYIQFQKLFENALNWGIMSYTFHPYYWADECEWSALLQIEDDDPTFAAFRQAGMAQVLVPVGCTSAADVLFYIQTGNPMAGGDLVGEDHEDLYASILNDLRDCNEERVVEETFQSRVPSTLTILQKESALIDEAGLPCCDEVKAEESENTLVRHDKALKRLATESE
ncbi:MAG: hypothetical protein QNJ44_15025 [Rhodobacter sp.]|nr:hypothetical protein [Rhodobacter sp.]